MYDDIFEASLYTLPADANKPYKEIVVKADDAIVVTTIDRNFAYAIHEALIYGEQERASYVDYSFLEGEV